MCVECVLPKESLFIFLRDDDSYGDKYGSAYTHARKHTLEAATPRFRVICVECARLFRVEKQKRPLPEGKGLVCSSS